MKPWDGLKRFKKRKFCSRACVLTFKAINEKTKPRR